MAQLATIHEFRIAFSLNPVLQSEHAVADAQETQSEILHVESIQRRALDGSTVKPEAQAEHKEELGQPRQLGSSCEQSWQVAPSK